MNGVIIQIIRYQSTTQLGTVRRRTRVSTADAHVGFRSDRDRPGRHKQHHLVSCVDIALADARTGHRWYQTGHS